MNTSGKFEHDFDWRAWSCQDGPVAGCDRRKVSVKKFATWAAAAGLIVSLSACAPDEAEPGNLDLAQGADGCQLSGNEVESIEFSGVFGQAPVVDFDGPLEVSRTQRFVVIEGDGEVVKNGDDVLIDYSLHNAASGEVLEAYEDYDASVFSLNTNSPILVGVSLTVACSTLGSRVAGLIPAEEAFGPDGAPDAGVNAGEAILFVVDVIAINPPALDRLDGEPAEPADGFPAVEYAEDGSPTVTIPEGVDVPTEFALETVIAGTGAEVGAGAVAIIQYHGVNWNTGEVFDSSWLRGQVARFPVGNLIPGFQDALIGQTVGSRVLVIIPPELGYGPMGGQPDAGIGPEDTIFFVIDILGTQ